MKSRTCAGSITERKSVMGWSTPLSKTRKSSRRRPSTKFPSLPVTITPTLTRSTVTRILAACSCCFSRAAAAKQQPSAAASDKVGTRRQYGFIVKLPGDPTAHFQAMLIGLRKMRKPCPTHGYPERGTGPVDNDSNAKTVYGLSVEGAVGAAAADGAGAAGAGVPESLGVARYPVI